MFKTLRFDVKDTTHANYNSPGQGFLLQGLVSSLRPTQSFPPWAGLGLVHVRARV